GIFRPSYNAYLYQLVTCSIISWRGQMAKLPKLDDRPLSQEDWMAAPVLSITVGDFSVAWFDSAWAAMTNRQPQIKGHSAFSDAFNLTPDMLSSIAAHHSIASQNDHL
ncbi:MAG: hypothetical protein WBO88_01670, partial [Candidatus Dechloromonas phosphoritropha]